MNRAGKPYRSIPVVEFLLAREEIGAGRDRKRRPRDPEERAVLMDLALHKMEKADQNLFVSVGFRRRRIQTASRDGGGGDEPGSSRSAPV